MEKLFHLSPAEVLQEIPQWVQTMSKNTAEYIVNNFCEKHEDKKLPLTEEQIDYLFNSILQQLYVAYRLGQVNKDNWLQKVCNKL